MATLLVPNYGEVVIPNGISTLNAFRKWVHSGVLPEKLPVHFLQGEVWLDFYMEEVFSHGQVKDAVHRVVSSLVADQKLGRVFPDRTLLTNDEAALAAEPDLMYASFRTLKSKRIRYKAGATTGAFATEVVGTPDLVVEIVSPSSEDKDLEKLMTLYHDAGIPEYWLIDARAEPLRFEILKHTTKEYGPMPIRGGWVKSPVFGRAFRLTQGIAEDGYPSYDLEIR